MKIILCLADGNEFVFESDVPLSENCKIRVERTAKAISISKAEFLVEDGVLCQLVTERAYNNDYWKDD